MMLRAFPSRCVPLVLACVLTLFARCEAAESLRAQASQASPTWGHAAIVDRDGDSIFEVDRKPFFLYGAAFFYERLPRDTWRSSMASLKGLGINTLDLYVPWNWHELSDGDFDFTGRTSPRRDFDEVLRLAKELDFKIILRPGPVVRNEWRNGGYPAWLLSRPEYGMPSHDLLEGRYPPTATLQNQHSDDAAAEWMRNATHMKYSARWLARVLKECAPVADRVVAVALDDDQGAYIDNQTYPAPHFQAYIDYLRDTVHASTGPNELTFINTYQMKVTASSPVWAMGNWYQSEAFSLGEHDEAQLEFSTGLLHTRPHQPMFASEFQAGWLEQADDIRPRPADPRNTALADTTMIGLGVRGIVNFPAQDTLNPPGWEAPFSNVFYAWDAALDLSGSRTERGLPTMQIGALVTAFGPELAASEPLFDAAIVYQGASVKPEAATNGVFSSIASATIDAQKACRDAKVACTLVDAGSLDDAALARHRVLIVPAFDGRSTAIDPNLDTRLARRPAGTIVTGDVTASAIGQAVRTGGRRPIVDGVPNARFARVVNGKLEGFLSTTNYGDSAIIVDKGTIAMDGRRTIALPKFTLAAHASLVVPIGIRLHAIDGHFGKTDRIDFWNCMPTRFTTFENEIDLGSSFDERGTCRVYLTLGDRRRLDEALGPIQLTHDKAGYSITHFRQHRVGSRFFDKVVHVEYIRSDAALAVDPFPKLAPNETSLSYTRDVYRDGFDSNVLDNGLVRLVVTPTAGARAFSFVDDATGKSCFTTVGAMRDDVAVEPPLSTTDRIAKYTHDMPAGMFDRAYAVTAEPSNPLALAFRYDAPDVLPSGARFTRVVTLDPKERAFTMDESVDFHGIASGDAQRAVSVNSLSVGDALSMASERVLSPASAAFAADTDVRVTAGNALGYYDIATRELATIAWRAGDIDDATIRQRRFSIIARLTLARGRPAHVRYGYETAATEADAVAALAKADAAAQVTPTPGRIP